MSKEEKRNKEKYVLVAEVVDLPDLGFPLTIPKKQAVRGVQRKLDADNDTCGAKHRRSAQFHPSPFERSFTAASPIYSQIGGIRDWLLLPLRSSDMQGQKCLTEPP
ncbi:hypothetical protein GIB67_009935 [Kingdonia uniflora]|uniref:Uncharacterized protein n=1 Tax=Kingdonia uniflora TaxID=39325 RepID=A0A7J7L4F6_9MAGN|nr:hypothetical protein GIB67_009935 [Kingdonia uniflora]